MKFFKKVKNQDEEKKSSSFDSSSFSEFILQAVENLPDGVQILDFDYKFLYVNNSLVLQSQTTKDKLLNHSIFEVFPGIENTRTFEIVKEAMEKRIVMNEDVEFQYPDGNSKWFELRVEPIDIGLVVFSIDISERVRKEKILQEGKQELEIINRTEKKFSGAMTKLLAELEKTKNNIEFEKARDDALLSSIGEGVFAVDTNNRFIFINKKAEEILGVKAKELLGKKKTPTNLPLFDFNNKPIPPEKRPTALALKTKKASFNERFYLGRPDGTTIPISLTVTPVKLDNKVIGAVDVFRDITEEIRVDKAKSEFVSVASHQLRTPLGIIKWYVEMLEKDEYIKNAPGKIYEYIKEVGKGNEKLLNLVRDLLSVSRIDQNKVQDNPEVIEINDFIVPIVEDIRVLGNSYGVEIKLELGSSIPKIKVDSLKLTSVIENLLSNALKYSKFGNGVVTVSTSSDEESVLVTVEDNGIGIAKEDIKDLFQKFFRAENAVINNPDGSGLGLYVAKSYIDSFGGKITVDSQINKGSKFTVYIPIYK